MHLTLPPGPAITVSGSTASLNAGYGIEATNGVDDGGVPNHAEHSGNPAQCLGLVCLP